MHAPLNGSAAGSLRLRKFSARRHPYRRAVTGLTSAARGRSPAGRATGVKPATVAIALATLLLAGCGGDTSTSAADPAERERAAEAHVTLAEARRFLERGDLALVYEATGGRAGVAAEVRPAPSESARLAGQSSRELDLLVFATPAAARAAWESVLDTEIIDEGGRAVRVVNLVAVFPERGLGSDTYRRVRERLRLLAVACRARDRGSPEADEICFGDPDGGVPPSGEGTDADELVPSGTTVTLGGIRYDVTIARQLNPRIEPDEALTGGRRPGDGRLFFGVFLRACNPSGATAMPTGRLTLVDAFGSRAEPVVLPESNPFAYDPARIEAGDCIPREDSAAERTVSGALLLFELPRERLGERPLGLEIVSRDGRDRATIELDV